MEVVYKKSDFATPEEQKNTLGNILSACAPYTWYIIFSLPAHTCEHIGSSLWPAE